MEINNIKDFDNIIKENKLVLVDFWAAWCGPCRMVGPIIDELKTEEPEGVKVLKIDVTKNSEIATKYSIRNIPAVLLYKNGKVVDKLIGVNSKEKYIDMIKANK